MAYEAVECFWVEPTGKAVRTLRRYRRGEDKCEHPDNRFGYHCATVDLDGEFDVVWSPQDDGSRYIAAIDCADYAGDDRWPKNCVCGYEFIEEDHWQARQEPIYAAEDGRRAWTSPAYGRKPTPGAMFDTYWMPERRKEDGLCISVVCPDGAVWCVDGPAGNGDGWTREGAPPKITAQPSILTPDYHGYLQNGILTAG